MKLPWENNPPPPDEPPPPPPPPPVLSEPPTQISVVPGGAGTGGTHAKPAIDVGTIASDAFQEALGDPESQLRQQLTDYVRTTVGAMLHGQKVDMAHPTVIATTAKGRELVIADARSRSVRTLIQGLGIDLLFGICAAVATLSGADPFSQQTWIIFAGLLIKTVIQTVVAYFMRLRITPTMKTDEGRMQIMPLPIAPPS